MHNAKKIVYTNSYSYYQRKHDKSITRSFNPNHLVAIEWSKSIETFCRNYYPSILNAAFCRTFNVSIHLILLMPFDTKDYDKYFKIIWREIVRTRKKVLIDKKVRYREKIAAILSYFGITVLKKVWNSKFAIRQKEYS